PPPHPLSLHDALPISVDLAYGNPVAELGPGDLFGEMTCMNFYPRSAAVIAESDVVAFEMLRNVLDIMLKNKTFRGQLDHTYRRRSEEHTSELQSLAYL